MPDSEKGLDKKAGTATSKKPWTKVAIVGTAVIVVIAIALGVGLGVGLTRNRNADGGDGSNSNGSGSSSGNNNNNITTSTSPTNVTRTSTWRPPVGASWQIILRQPIDVVSGGNDTALITPNADVWDIDMYENPATTISTLQTAGKKVICYFSAGSYEDWRPDKAAFQAADLGKDLAGWPGERWLNVSSASVRSVMASRVKLASDKGCDAVDPDNVDGYQNDNGLGLTRDDAVAFVRFLQGETARYNMSLGLKNAGDIIADVLDVVDFSVNEQCVQHGECATFAAFVQHGKPVFNIEYPDDVGDAAVRNICSHQGASRGSDGFSQVVKRMKLDGWVKYCDGKTYETRVKTS
ncbi:Glycoside hydrolase, superfamily [Moelleriella libera RCEF 2490]|uniref:alpha-galactosidase n=1 Tax=Moelleriella libera RCEF 2490 TaxID=1081109 RepID=A0A162IJH5_9HYPO|nr:Glycoside hydrolase, superfamily [Moelleriella libera RCEF 2490]